MSEKNNSINVLAMDAMEPIVTPVSNIKFCAHCGAKLNTDGIPAQQQSIIMNPNTTICENPVDAMKKVSQVKRARKKVARIPKKYTYVRLQDRTLKKNCKPKPALKRGTVTKRVYKRRAAPKHDFCTCTTSEYSETNLVQYCKRCSTKDISKSGEERTCDTMLNKKKMMSSKNIQKLNKTKKQKSKLTRKMNRELETTVDAEDLSYKNSNNCSNEAQLNKINKIISKESNKQPNVKFSIDRKHTSKANSDYNISGRTERVTAVSHSSESSSICHCDDEGDDEKSVICTCNVCELREKNRIRNMQKKRSGTKRVAPYTKEVIIRKRSR